LYPNFKLAGMMVKAELITKATNPMANNMIDATPFDSFIFLPVARILMKFIGEMKMKSDAQWPAPIAPLTFEYVREPDKVDLPEDKKR
jgi:hypothetical protein